MTEHQGKILDKKLDCYGNEKNFRANDELMVTITLDEYRELCNESGKRSAYARLHDLEDTIVKLSARVAVLEK